METTIKPPSDTHTKKVATKTKTLTCRRAMENVDVAGADATPVSSHLCATTTSSVKLDILASLNLGVHTQVHT